MLSIVAAACLSGCSTNEPVAPPTINLIDEIWASIRAEIDRLEQEHATSAEWQKAKALEDSARVKSLENLHSIIKGLELDASEKKQLDELFTNSSKTMHFGFECQYHALVFFDSNDRSKYVVKW